MADENTYVNVFKVDARLGIVFGYAMVCKIDGEEYYDLQDDHITEAGMLEAAAEYMMGDRTIKVMHRDETPGKVVFAFPLTTDIAKAFNITTPMTGLIIGMKPEDPAVLRAFDEGTFKGFSMGGRILVAEYIEEVLYD